MDRLSPLTNQAERRPKRKRWDRNRWDIPLPRVGGALSARSPQYRGRSARCQTRPARRV